MKKHFRYLFYIFKHKWFVFVECCKLGIPWLGITHDWSKFRPSEWFSYAEHFHGEGKEDRKFDYAWLLHQKRNKHHWQFWVLQKNGGGIKILDMPPKYCMEMLADLKSTGKVKTGKDDITKWYLEHRDKMKLGEKTKFKLESVLFPRF